MFNYTHAIIHASQCFAYVLSMYLRRCGTVNRTPRKMQHRTCGVPAVVGMLLLGWYRCTLRWTPQCPAHPTCHSLHRPRAGRTTSALGYIVIILVLRHLDLDSSVARHEFLTSTKRAELVPRVRKFSHWWRWHAVPPVEESR